MPDIQDLDVVDANNTGRWPENMAFNLVNNAGRADEGILARWYKDWDNSITSSGSSNAYAITSNRTISSLVNNTVMAWTANFTNTDAATLNLNGLGAKGIKRFNGSDLAAGDIISGQPLLVCYKSSPDQWFMLTAPAALVTSMFADFSENATPGNPAADTGRLSAFDDSGVTMLRYGDSGGTFRELLGRATQAQMEAGTDVRQGVSAGRQHFHPGHPKAGGNLNGSGTPAFRSGDYGMGAVTDNAAGNWTLALDTAFANTDYWCAAWARGSGSSDHWCSATTGSVKTASTFGIRVDGGFDSTEVGISFWGDHA